MDISDIVALLVFLFPLAFSPGPGNLFFAANGARFGILATIGAMTGYHVATFAVALVMGFGVATALTAAAQTFTVIKIAGSLYVLWLAWTLWRAKKLDQLEAQVAGSWDGAVLLLLNPKAYVIIALMCAQFLTESSGTAEVMVIAVVFTVNNLTAFMLYTVVGDRLAQAFRNESHERNINATFGVILAMVGVWMLLS